MNVHKYRINVSFDNAHKHEEYIYSIAIDLTSYRFEENVVLA